MKTKQEAEKMRDMFVDLTKNFHPEDGWVKDLDSAKRAGIIAVDLIIGQLEQLSKAEYSIFITDLDPLTTENGYEKIDFWEEVKKEIELL